MQLLTLPEGVLSQRWGSDFLLTPARMEEAQLSRGKYRNILHSLVYDMHIKFPSVYGVYRNYDEVSKFPYGNLKVNIRNI